MKMAVLTVVRMADQFGKPPNRPEFRQSTENLREEAALILLWLQDPELSEEDKRRGWELFELLLR
jgi:hypothetical protein